MDFDLQKFLSEMRKEQKDDHDALAEKLDGVLVKLSDHETRIVVVENTHRSVRWLGGAIVVAFLGFVFDVVFNHLPRMLAAWAGPARP